MQVEFDPDDLPAPRTRTELTPRNIELVRAQAAVLGFMLPDDVCALGAMKHTTPEAWAKRGEGPPYVMFGNRRLYPIDGVREFLRGRIKARAGSASGFL